MRISAYQIQAARERLLWSHEDEQLAVFPAEGPFSLGEKQNLKTEVLDALTTAPRLEGI